MTDAAVSYPSSVSVDIGASGSLDDHMPGSGNPTLGTLTGVTMRTFPHLDPVCRYVHKCLLIFRSSAVCFSMLSMCVLTSIYPLRSIDLVLSPILFSTAYQPNIILIKTMYHPNTLAGTSDERRPGGRAGQLPLRVWRGGERL